MARYPETSPIAVPQPAQHRNASVESAVVVPLLLTAISGTLIGLPLGVVAAFIPGAPWWIALVVAYGIVTPVIWALLAFPHLRALWAIEEITGLDLDGDGEAGKPVQQTFMIEVTTRGSIKRIPFPGQPARFACLVKGLLAGAPLTEKKWTPASKLYSKPTLRRIRAILLEAGYWKWNNPLFHFTGGCLTDPGRDALEEWLNTYQVEGG